MQQTAFEKEWKALKKGNTIPNDSKLMHLNPKLDEDDLMRSDSRLSQAEYLPHDVKYPIILPRKHRVTKLIVKEAHEQGFHVAGTNQTLGLHTILDTMCPRRNT